MSPTSIEHIDILIIGSGPAGASTAMHLLQSDPSWAGRMIIVDKAVHPREKLCGGGITYLGENILADLGLSIEPTNFPVREVRLVYEDQSYSFWGNPVFRIVHRAEFDHWLVQQVEKHGVDVRQGEGVVDVIPHDEAGFVEVRTEHAVYHAKSVVAADGSRSLVRRRLKWDDDSRVSRLIEVLTPETRQTSWEIQDGVAVFDFSPMTTQQLQGYYWDFPSVVNGNLMMNRGVFDSRARPERPKADLKQTLRNALDERERDLNDYAIKGHPIRWFHWQGKFSRPHVLLAGDAAGADPLFGEGIAMALAYGKVAAAELERAFSTTDFSFSGYRRRILSNGILLGVAVRTALARLTYLKKFPRLIRLGWRIAGWVIRLTPWANPDYVPARAPKQSSTFRSSTSSKS